MPPTNAFFILGLTNSSAGDLLSDAWKVLCGGLDTNTSYDATISFGLSLPQGCVNTNIVTGSVQVLGGYPTFMAVLVNDTNFDNAFWVPLTNLFSVDLGASDGPKDVWVGLAGPLPDIQPVWQSAQLVLDQTPPALHITSPTNAAAPWPMIQLQGYSEEPLSSLYFDVSN